MSLRAFHLLFIGFSALLAAFLAAWAAGHNRVEHHAGYVAAGVASVACAGALVAYAAAFQRKTRGLS